MRVKIKSRSMSTSVGFVQNEDIIDLPDAEVEKILTMRPDALEVIPVEEKPVFKSAAPKKKATRKRARNADGTLKGDDPSTPDVNEAYEDG
tara:strand:- start:330 stop:602 length:273 start_codon:yes stop_codon:yes gene_type:complete